MNDSQREKTFLKYFGQMPSSVSVQNSFYNFFYIVHSAKNNKLKSKLST